MTKLPIRRTESPKGASPNNRSVRRTKDDEPTEHCHAQPCVPEGSEYRRCSYYTGGHATGLPDLLFHQSINLPIYQSTSLPVYQSTNLPASDGRPLRGRSLQRWAIRRFVGQALLTLRLFKFAPFGDAAAYRRRSPHEKL